MSDSKRNNHASAWRRASRLIAITVGSLILAALVGVVFLTFWLTPSRLSAIVSERASNYLDANVKVSGLRFTFWSSFPRLSLEADSLTVVSRSLDSLPAEIRRELPSGADSLLAISGFRGGVNVPQLFRGKVKLHDVVVSGLNLNLVAATDKNTNYDIFPTTDKTKSHLPEIIVDTLRIDAPKEIRWYSRPSGLDAHVALNRVDLTALNSSGRYDCKLSGRLSLDAGRMILLTDFPVSLSGDLLVDYKPMRIRFSDYDIALGNVNAHVSMNLKAEDSPSLSDFHCDIEEFRLFRLLDYLPKALVPGIGDLQSDIDISASLKLTAPYSLTADYLPSLQLRVTIPDGHLDYSLHDNDQLRVNHLGLTATLNFDGKHPDKSRLEIPQCEVNAAGTDFHLSAEATDLFGRPKLTALWDCAGDMSRLSSCIPWLKDASVKGSLKATGRLAFQIDDFRQGNISNLQTEATLSWPRLSMVTEPNRSALKASNLRVDISAKGKMEHGNISFIGPTDYVVAIGDVRWRRDSTLLALKEAHLQGTMTLLHPNATFDTLQSHLMARHFNMSAPRHTLALEGLATKVSFRHATPGEIAGLQRPLTRTERDSETLTRIRHTPEVLTAGLHPSLAKFVSNWRLSADVDIDSAQWNLDSYPHPFRLHNADLSFDFDSLTLRHFDIESGVSQASVSGSAGGFRRFFAFDRPSPLHMRLSADCNNIDVNQIAKATHKDKSHSINPEETQPAAWLVPRNLEVTLDIAANDVIYTNLDLRNANLRLESHEGDLSLKNLTMDTDFGELALELEYDSSSISDLRAEAAMQINQLQLTPFFDKFKSMTSHMPQIKNLSGEMEISGKLGFDIFPDMTVEMASMQATLDLEGKHLKLKQDDFIRHIARMILITNDRDIEIADVKALAEVHDNLLELYPFILGFDKYKLELMGVNNFAGDLDYHVEALRSPLPFPFGINVEGKYHHPRIRFGGEGWSPDKSREITSEVMKSFGWNFAEKMSRVGHELIHKAATGQTL